MLDYIKTNELGLNLANLKFELHKCQDIVDEIGIEYTRCMGQYDRMTLDMANMKGILELIDSLIDMADHAKISLEHNYRDANNRRNRA